MEAPAGELGNAPRAPVSGPNYVNTDFFLIKHIVVTSEPNSISGLSSSISGITRICQQHAKRIAVFHPDVSGCQSDGEPVTGDSRVVQFALKLVF